jgi:hypothetical protein
MSKKQMDSEEVLAWTAIVVALVLAWLVLALTNSDIAMGVVQL